MKTQHFNGLSEAQTERLALLIEECGEVIQIASKILRHGYQSQNPNHADYPDSPTNQDLLNLELGDLQFAVLLMEDHEDVDSRRIIERRAEKAKTIERYLHHQPLPLELSI